MLSIVIPTLNEEGYLGRLLESIEKQDYNDYEVIVADSESEDDTVEKARSYGCRIVNTDKRGPGHGRNKGAEKAEGGKILFLDADVELRDSKTFDRVVEALEDEDIVAGSSSWIPKDGGLKGHIFLWLGTLMIEIEDSLLGQVSGTGNFLFTEKEVFENIGGFDEEMPFFEDVDFLKRADELGEIKLLRRQMNVSTRRAENNGLLKATAEYTLPYLYFTLGKKDAMKKKFAFKTIS